MQWNGVIDSISAKQDKAGETIATVKIRISTWNPERELPPLLDMLKGYVSMTFVPIDPSDEEE